MDDAVVLHAYSVDPAFRQYEENPALKLYEFNEVVHEIIASRQLRPRTMFYFVVTRSDDDTPLGSVYLSVEDLDSRQAELGYMIGAPHWGQGFGTEAASVMMKFGFRKLHLRRIYVTNLLADNSAAVRVADKLGMRREAHFRDHKYFQDRWWDTYLYAITYHEWEQQRT